MAKPNKDIPNHDHDWHLVEHYVEKIHTTGLDIYTCCICGLRIERQWVTEKDPDHGVAIPVTLRWYKSGLPKSNKDHVPPGKSKR